jgi:phosphoglycolate phosphatase-like HAD superfamily hydrolase
MYKLFIFDMDGTLIDSVDKWADLFERTLHKYHINVPRDHLKSTFGREAAETLHMLIPNGMAKVATHFFMTHQSEYIDTFQVFPSSLPIFKELKEKGFKISIATGNNRRLMDYFLKKFGLTPYIDFCICADDVHHGKPNPEMLIKTLEHFNLKPEEAFFVADAPMDFLAAKGAHIKIGLVTTGVLCEDRAKELKPACVMNDLREVEKLM